jgi:hypothetical protein
MHDHHANWHEILEVRDVPASVTHLSVMIIKVCTSPSISRGIRWGTNFGGFFGM